MNFPHIFTKKYPVVRQYDQIDCGPAALLSVLKFYGGDSNLVHIRELSNTDARGSNMLGLVNAAKELGFDAFGATGEYEDLLKEQMPCIAHVVLENRLQHFVVIYEIDEKGVLVGDPGKGLYRLTRGEFLKIWIKKAAVLLEPIKELHTQETTPWLRWIFAYFQKEESWLYQSIFLGIVYTALGLMVSLFVQWLIDRFIPERDLGKIILTGAFLLALQCLRAGAGFLRQCFMIELNKRVSVNINKEFLSHIFHLPLSFFNTRKKGDITARINDTIKIQRAVLQIVGVTIIDGLIIIGSFAFIFYLAPQLGWVALATLPFYALLLILATRRIKREQREVMKSYAQAEAFYFDSLGGIDEVLSYSASGPFSRTNQVIFKNYQEKTAMLGNTQARISLWAELAAGALVVSLLGYGAALVIQEALLLGQMMAAYSLLANMLPAINGLVGANISLQGAAVAAQRLMDLLLVEKEKNTSEQAIEKINKIEVKNLEFAWPRGEALYENLNINIEKGKITALWGVSGSGKSTLIKILQRKYAPKAGAITVDGIPVDNFELTSYRRQIAVVPQTVKIFNGTIFENIILGREITDISLIENRIKQLGLATFLERFEARLFTIIGEEGRDLSSGETQMLCIIRALLEEPQVLILDEGISAIDVEIENFIFSVLRNYAREHVVFIISHNLRTIYKTDYVYILQNKQIRHHGAPKDLLRKNARFRNLWQLQQGNGALSVADEVKERADIGK